MNYQFFVNEMSAPDVQTAYNACVADATEEWGSRYDSGCISATQMGSCVGKFNSDSPRKNQKDYLEFLDRAERNDSYETGIAYWLEVNENRWLIQALHETEPATNDPAQFKMGYEVQETATGSVLYTTTLKKEAIRFAKGYAVEKRKNLRIYKKPILVAGNDLILRLRTSATEIISKTNPAKKGQSAQPLHLYVFFGWARM